MEKKKIFKVKWAILVGNADESEWKTIEVFRSTKSLAEDLARQVETASTLLGFIQFNRISPVITEVDIL